MSSPRFDRGRPPRIAVVLAGGHGTRFWPRSRQDVPKQLLRITGRTSMLQATVRRVLPLVTRRNVVVVTNDAHAAAVRRQLPELAPNQILVEPVGRNTLPCIALAAEWIRGRIAGATMLVVPADHVIKDAKSFRQTAAAACELAERRGALVTLGVRPTRPESGYGYIQLGRAIGDAAAPANWVRTFREKPTVPVAQRFVRSGRYLWNAGVFAWRVDSFDAALERYAPAVRAALQGVWVGSGTAVRSRLRRVYRGLPATSVDVGVMEPATAAGASAPRVAVVHATFDWNDVGSWVTMPELWGCDRAGNATIGKLVPIDAADSIVYSPERLVALIGVRDLIVVDSADALLICARARAQDVRAVPQELRRRGWVRYL